MPAPIAAARRIAALTLDQLGRAQDAAIIRAGGGDDFAEVRVALAALASTGARVDLLERALGCYADEDFWEAEVTEGTLAYYDHGEIARTALAGRDAMRHRD